MIRVRDDDVISQGSSLSDPLSRFVRVHEIIAEAGALHVPGILCGYFRHFDGAPEFVRDCVAAGEMEPQIHGWAHFPYHTFTTKRIVHHLNLCLDYFDTTWQIRPTKFFTPWGGDTTELRAACDTTELELVDCSNLQTPRDMRRRQNHWRGKAHTQDVDLFIHWWEAGLGRLERVLQLLNEEV